MNATDMLTAFAVDVYDENISGIYYMYNSQLLAFTGIRIDSNKNLVLYRENKKPNLSIKDFLTTLMKNKQSPIMYTTGAKSQNVYGFRMENGKIIL